MIELRHGDWTASVEPGGELTCHHGREALPWRIALADGAAVTLTDGSEQGLDPAGLTLCPIAADRVQWLGAVGGAEVALDLALDDDGLLCSISPLGGPGATIAAARWPGRVTVAGEPRAVCWCNHQQGALFAADGQPWSTTVDWSRSCARFGGLLGAAGALAVIVETPFDAVSQLADDCRSLSLSVGWTASLGTLAYRRSVRFVPVSEPTHVACAKAFRRWAQRHGLWKPWAERVEENPAVAGLVGAFVACAGYWHDAEADIVGTMRTLRDLGFDRGYLFSPRLYTFGDDSWAPHGARYHRLSDRDLAAVQELGYLAAPFLQVEEADQASVGGEALCRDRDGQPIQRWQIGETRFQEIAKWRVPAMLPRFDAELAGANAVHFDTLTAMPLVEHWGARPYDRRGDLAQRREIASYYRNQGKVIGAECQIDEATGEVDLATAKAFWPLVDADPRVWSAPLTDLVYHDSLVRCHWEHHAYDDDRCVRTLWQRAFHPWAMELGDLLTASPPVLFPSGALYEFGHDEVTLPDGRVEWRTDMSRVTLYHKRLTDPETQAALPKALRVCGVHRRHGTAEMIDHRFLDGWRVQASEFSTGLRVVANYSDEDRDGLPPRSASVQD